MDKTPYRRIKDAQRKAREKRLRRFKLEEFCLHYAAKQIKEDYELNGARIILKDQDS